MFTGIVQTKAPIVDIKKKNNIWTIFVKFPKKFIYNLTVGASINVNGCCLTVTDIKDNIVSFDIIQETLRLTNFFLSDIGDQLNLERAVTFNSEIGGHLISGHIMCTAKLNKIINFDNNYQMWFNILNKKYMKYILYKEYISIEGISLTIGNIKNDFFSINVIPETLKRTNLKNKKIGDHVNIEVDQQVKIIVDIVEKNNAIK